MIHTSKKRELEDVAAFKEENLGSSGGSPSAGEHKNL